MSGKFPRKCRSPGCWRNIGCLGPRNHRPNRKDCLYLGDKRQKDEKQDVNNIENHDADKKIKTKARARWGGTKEACLSVHRFAVKRRG